MTQNGHNVFLRSMYGYGFPILEPWATINLFLSTRWSINPLLDLKPQCGRIIIQIKRQNSTEEILEAPFQMIWWMKRYSWDPGHFNRIWLHFRCASLTRFWPTCSHNGSATEQIWTWQFDVRACVFASAVSIRSCPGVWEAQLLIPIIKRAIGLIFFLNDFVSLNSVSNLSLFLHLIVDSRETVLCFTVPHFSWSVVNIETMPFAEAHYICFVLIRSYFSSKNKSIDLKRKPHYSSKATINSLHCRKPKANA